MPKAGFKTITVSDYVYDTFFGVYKKNKRELAMNGIFSFSGYITDLVRQSTEKSRIFTKYQEVIQKISVDKDRVILQDIRMNRIVEIIISKGDLFCQLCERDSCLHVGYCYSIHNIYKNLGK